MNSTAILNDDIATRPYVAGLDSGAVRNGFIRPGLAKYSCYPIFPRLTPFCRLNAKMQPSEIYVNPYLTQSLTQKAKIASDLGLRWGEYKLYFTWCHNKAILAKSSRSRLMPPNLVNFSDHPGVSAGVRLRAEIERLGLDQIKVAEETGVSRQTINNIVNDRQQISRAMAAKLGRLTGRSPDYWLKERFSPTDIVRKQVSDDFNRARTSPNDELSSPSTGVGLLVNRQIVRAVRDRTILIDPFFPDNVQRASLDLTLDDFIITMTGEKKDISDGQNFPLESGQTVNVSTKEWIEFPVDYVGRVGAMAKVAKYGVVVSHGIQVDPGYKGQLQFCVFNAGGADFPLHSGMPIISLEIVRLAVTPSDEEGTSAEVPSSGDRAEVADRFHGSTYRKCDRLIRQFLESHVVIDTADNEVAASIRKLELEIVESTVEAATAAAIDASLVGLKAIRKASDPAMELSRKYEAFFDEVADKLYLSADHVQAAITALGLRLEGKNNEVTLRNGEATMLQLPLGTAKIRLRNLARQIREDPRDLILVLTQQQ